MDAGYDFTPQPPKNPETQAAFLGGPPQPPPRPPKITARDVLDPDDSGKRVFIPDYIEVRDLAELLRLKPFKVLAAALELRVFACADDFIDFSTASRIATRFGFVAEKLL